VPITLNGISNKGRAAATAIAPDKANRKQSWFFMPAL
jgi:hypothetical protein